MRIELIPDPGRDDPAAHAATIALAKAGLIGTPTASAIDSAWLREGIRDAVERASLPEDDYVVPRKTFGAPRA